MVIGISIFITLSYPVPPVDAVSAYLNGWGHGVLIPLGLLVGSNTWLQLHLGSPPLAVVLAYALHSLC